MVPRVTARALRRVLLGAMVAASGCLLATESSWTTSPFRGGDSQDTQPAWHTGQDTFQADRQAAARPAEAPVVPPLGPAEVAALECAVDRP